MINHPYEVIVIGSGATGGVSALTFAEAGIRVLVIEAGPELSAKTAFGNEPINTFNRITGIVNGEWRNQAQHPGFWKTNPKLYTNEKENPYTHPKNNPFLWTQGRQVGGRSLTWGGITLRLSQEDLKASRNDCYGPEWPLEYSDLTSHYTFLEKLLKVHGNQDNLKQIPDGNYLAPFPFTASENSFAEKVTKTLDFPFIHSRGFGPRQQNTKDEWPISSSPGSTLGLAIKTGNVELLSNHMVEKITMNSSLDKAKGVVVVNQTNGERIELEGSLIVLCASTIQSLRILLSSKEKSDSKGFIDPSDSLGCNLMDHISTCRFFALPNNNSEKNSSELEDYQKLLSGAGSFFIPFGKQFSNTPETEFIRGYGIWGGIDRFEPPGCLKKVRDTKTGFLIGHGEVLPSKNNKVTLSDKTDRWGISAPHINCSWGENENAMVKHMSKTIEIAIKSGGGQILNVNELFRIPFGQLLINNSIALKNEASPPGYYIHEVGGAPMGKSEKVSVVDSFNRLWRCPNVLVVDGACWPTSAWQSPTLTMMAISRRACTNALSVREMK